MHEIKIIMSDVDGTILNDQGRATPRTIEAIKKARAQGLIFGLASGRDIESSESLFKEWGLEGLVDVFVGENGAHIKDYRLGIDEKSYFLDPEVVKIILDHFRDLPINYMVVVDGIFYMVNRAHGERYVSLIGNVTVKQISEEEMLKLRFTKLHFFCTKELMPTVLARTTSFDHPEIVGVQTADTFYEYFDAKVSKSNGLRKVIEMDHLSLEDLLVFGDADNDVSMLADSKVGVVMGNGTPLAKSVANYVTEDNNHDGIAVFLEKYILKNA